MAQDEQSAQALLEGRARWDTLRRPGCRFRPESALADGGDNRWGALRPGRFAARDRAGYRRLVEGCRLTGANQNTHHGPTRRRAQTMKTSNSPMKTSNSRFEEYDLVVIGSGAGGKLLAWTSAQKGQRV